MPSPEAVSHVAVFSHNAFKVRHAPVAVALFVTGGLLLCLLTVRISPPRWRGTISNEFYTEWFPSISSVIGDFWPQKSFWRIAIGLSATPKFVTLAVNYCVFGLMCKESGNMALRFRLLVDLAVLAGLLRTICAGLFTFVSSSEFLQFHIASFVGFVLFGIFERVLLERLVHWTMIIRGDTDGDRWSKSFKAKKMCNRFYALVVSAMAICYYKHRQAVYGAYSIYALFEWTLALIEMFFEASAWWDFGDTELTLISAEKRL
jgi:hypothetical protein